MLIVHESLSRLEKVDGRQARFVELRYFGGLTVEEAGEVVGISAKTLMRELNVTKAWLDGDLKGRRADAVPPDKVLWDMLEAPRVESSRPKLDVRRAYVLFFA